MNSSEKWILAIPGRNPYFIGINSAIEFEGLFNLLSDKSQSLFYWN